MVFERRFSTWAVILQNPVRADFQPFIADTQVDSGPIPDVGRRETDITLKLSEGNS